MVAGSSGVTIEPAFRIEYAWADHANLNQKVGDRGYRFCRAFQLQGQERPDSPCFIRQTRCLNMAYKVRSKQSCRNKISSPRRRTVGMPLFGVDEQESRRKMFNEGSPKFKHDAAV